MRETETQLVIQQLQSQGFLPPQQHQQLLQESVRTGVNILQLIVMNHFVSEETLTQTIATVLHVPYANLLDAEVLPEALQVVSQEIAENYHLVPWVKEGNKVSIGLVDPQDYKAIEALDFIARKNRLQFTYYLISQSSLRAVLKKYENLGQEVALALEGQVASITDSLDDQFDDEGNESNIQTAPVSKMVAVILRYAVEGSASDVHIEPMEDVTRVRYRLDGILHTSLQLPKDVHSALVARIKVLANLKLDETRLPQDGRFHMKIDGHEVDFRVSTLPLVGNEKVVLRILDKESGIHSLEELGYADHNLEVIHQQLKRPHGMVVITGPTGSGKSTTLYAMLQILNQEQRNIITLEDPVEYNMPGIAQSQIRPEIGLTFARGLRSILRQDPDIIMVGEIRDNETAELGIHAALTGHLLLSTLHTNNAIGAIPRLVDMKIEPFLISSALSVVIAQRLVRKNCTECLYQLNLPENIVQSTITEIQNIPNGSLPEDIAMKIREHLAGASPLMVYRGKGCHHCEDTGYKGRVAISEVIQVTDRMQEIIASGEINKTAIVLEELRLQGMITLKQDGLIKALRGATSIEEVLTVASE